MSPIFAALMPVLGFFLSHMVYKHYSQVPIDDISTNALYGLMAWDIGVTVGLNGLCAYHLSTLSYRPRRVWAMSVITTGVLVAGNCLFRQVCLAFREPIYRLVAGMMAIPFTFLPVMGILTGIGLRVLNET